MPQTNHRCQVADKKQVAKSNLITVQRCSCGEYFITDEHGTHQAIGTEKALAEMLDSLIKLNLPGAIPCGRHL